MAKIVLNPVVKEVRGKVDDLVFRKHRGRIILSPKPQNGHELTEAQAAHRERFLEAVEFGKLVMADPEIRPLYDQVAKERDMPAFALCVADFFNPPTIHSIDASNYNGQVGDTITFITRDDFGVLSAHLTLTENSQGTPIESGEAVEVALNRWIYTATTAAPAGITVNVQAAAVDRPGGLGVFSTTKQI